VAGSEIDDDSEFEGQVMLPPKPLAPRKGRGAVSNLQGRYEVNGREDFDDGWLHVDENGDEDGQGSGAASFKTHVTDEYARTILSRNASPDIPFNVSLNPYRGCEHVMWTSVSVVLS
jgi:hypothetical protein